MNTESPITSKSGEQAKSPKTRTKQEEERSSQAPKARPPENPEEFLTRGESRVLIKKGAHLIVSTHSTKSRGNGEGARAIGQSQPRSHSCGSRQRQAAVC